MATKKTDSFANVAALYIEETAMNTQTMAKFNFPFSIMDKMALVLQRVEYWPGGLDQLNGTTDRTVFGLFASSSVVNIENQADPLIIDTARVQRIDFGAAASGLAVSLPTIKDFTTLAGGGILVAPSPLYLGIKATGAAGVTSVWARVYYTYVELSTDEYWQLVESRRIISS